MKKIIPEVVETYCDICNILVKDCWDQPDGGYGVIVSAFETGCSPIDYDLCQSCHHKMWDGVLRTVREIQAKK